jgi:sec-independent protein translocase protein TatA
VFSDILQPTHLLFILVVALLVLGPKRLPEVGRSLGRGLRDFRNALSGDDHDEVPADIGPPPPPEQPEPAAHTESAMHTEAAPHSEPAMQDQQTTHDEPAAHPEPNGATAPASETATGAHAEPAQQPEHVA